MKIITLLTDFSPRDGNVGVMKGVIWGIAPEVQISDLSHDVSPQNIREAAFILARSAPYFPEGTIHVVVVDPGVGTKRRPLAARLGEQYFVAPDNGVLTPLIERAEREGQPTQFVHLDQPQYWLPEVSDVFHGRDIFAPVGAHLAQGIPLESLGAPMDDPILILWPHPTRTAEGVRGEIVYIDHFGNLATNIQRADLADLGEVTVQLCGVEIQGLVRAFGQRPVGSLVALYSSTDALIVAVVNGSGAERLNAQIGDVVEVTPHTEQ